jgi:L-seryl-tRNA(Ser) seleniumtransferase
MRRADVSPAGRHRVARRAMSDRRGKKRSVMDNDLFRGIPQVERILEDARIARWFGVLSRPLAARLVAQELGVVRESIRRTGARPDEAQVFEAAEAACARAAARRLRRVINATGIILHTNLGRAPLPSEVWAAAAEVNTGYSTLEMDIVTGKRGRRGGIVPDLLSILTGGEDALVVNNNAAAVLLGLSAHAQGREVIVSRGEQVQIGGGFRIPEILALSGARMVEVGTTNITTLEDYTRALSPDTAMVLLVHSSNFRIRGFTETPGTASLARALPPGVVLAVDQGSGTTTEDIRGEEKVRTHVTQGAHLVFFSGDKVLGGPQAGIAVGKADLVRAMAAHPLARALRPGKAVYSLLEELLVSRLNGSAAGHAQRILSLPKEELTRMGRRILRRVPAGCARLVASEISSGGGSAPDEVVPSLSIEITAERDARAMLESLRLMPVPLIATIAEGRVRLSLATMHGEDERAIAAAIAAVAAVAAG